MIPVICHFNLKGLCKNGKNCTFLHPTKECYHFKQGKCNKGALCPFSHDCHDVVEVVEKKLVLNDNNYIGSKIEESESK
jgi:hypothetical protein